MTRRVGIAIYFRLPAIVCIEILPVTVTDFRHIINHSPCYQLQTNLAYIEEGYNMTLTDAPNDLGGRLCLNCALTTPELPIEVSIQPYSKSP